MGTAGDDSKHDITTEECECGDGIAVVYGASDGAFVATIVVIFIGKVRVEVADGTSANVSDHVWRTGVVRRAVVHEVVASTIDTKQCNDVSNGFGSKSKPVSEFVAEHNECVGEWRALCVSVDDDDPVRTIVVGRHGAEYEPRPIWRMVAHVTILWRVVIISFFVDLRRMAGR